MSGISVLIIGRCVMKIHKIIKREIYMAKHLIFGFLLTYILVLILQIIVPYAGGICQARAV